MIMKELSIEQKAKAYDEAVKEASIAYKDEDKHLKATLERIFPKLWESEDERIKKAIYKSLKYLENYLSWDFLDDVDILDAYAWLEKQGKKPQGKSALEAAKEEKVDNQNCVNPTNKPEPKFYEEDWITIDNPCQIINIGNSGNYIVQYCNDEETHVLSKNFCESYYHLWTIEDANDGDVLACENGWTCIFNCLNDNLFSSHCFMDNEGWVCENGGQGHTLNNRICGEIHPATKEQRDLLFSKMNEAGYEWDADKKELKNKEKSTWSEEDEKKSSDILAILRGGENCYYNSHILMDWLKSLKDRIGE